MKRIQKLLIVVCMVMFSFLAGCSKTGEVSSAPETESSQAESVESTEASSQSAAEDSDAGIPKEVVDTLSRNCYQAFHGYLSEAKGTDWQGFRLSDIDGDKIDELIAVRQDPESIRQGKQQYYCWDWEDHKITFQEMDPLTQIDIGKTVSELDYYDKDYMLLVLNAEGKSYLEGITKRDKDFFHLLVGIVWAEEGWADLDPERREGIEDYLVVSELGERTDARYSAAGTDELLYQYRMRAVEMTEFYKDVLGWDREFSPDHYGNTEIGVNYNKNGYMYGENRIGWRDYSVITKVERGENEMTVHAIMKSTYTDNRLAEISVSMAPKEGKYGYGLTGYEVARETGVDLETGQTLQEFQAENLHVRYIMERIGYADRLTPVIRELSFMENNEAQFTADAKKLLPALKKEYEANPGSDGSNVAAKSTLLASYDFAEDSKLLIYEDAVYGKVPPETGGGSEYGYYLNYYLLTPGNAACHGEIFGYNESFGDMPADRKGISGFRHYFLGCDSEGRPAIDWAYVSNTADFADEFMFCAKVGRSHDMTVDEEGWERYDEDYYVYAGYFRPDGTRIIGQYDTWQVATWEYVSHGAFIKDPKGKTLFEEGSGPEGYGYYVEGKKVPLEKKPEDTRETFCDVALNETTKLCGEIYYWDWENLINVDLVFIVDGVEVRHNLYSYKTFW